MIERRTIHVVAAASTHPNRRYARVGLFRADVEYATPVPIHLGEAVVPDFAAYPVNDRLFYGLREYAKIWATGRFAAVEPYLTSPEAQRVGGLRGESLVCYLMRDVPVVAAAMCFHRVRASGEVRTGDCNPRLVAQREASRAASCASGRRRLAVAGPA